MSRITHQEKIIKNAYKSCFLLCVHYCGRQETAKEVFNDAMLKYYKYEESHKVNEIEYPGQLPEVDIVFGITENGIIRANRLD